MSTRTLALAAWLVVSLFAVAAAPAAEPASQPSRIYIPYDQLKAVMQAQPQGVFLPFDEFQRLWKAAQGAPAGVDAMPLPYLISTARFKGKVGAELASMQMELTVDILADGWVDVPIALGEVAVTKAAFAQGTEGDAPLLRTINNQYSLLTRGKGRRTLVVDFVRQLVTQPGLNVLSFKTPAAAISTLELAIPEENMKVDVEPMLAATTTQLAADGKKATQLQAFLGSSDHVKLSWKPKTQAAEELEPVIMSTQVQHVDISEALISLDVRISYDIRRRGVDTFTIQLPRDFRVTSVDGANIAKWDLAGSAEQATTAPAAASAPATGPAVQLLNVKLFAPVKDNYTLMVRMERFLKEPQARVPLMPVVTHQALQSTGLLALSHSSRRSVELDQPRNLARVEITAAPEYLRNQAGLTVYRFLSKEYGADLVIGSVAPRLTAQELWTLGVDTDRIDLNGMLNVTIERAGVFEIAMNMPEGYEVTKVGPPDIVDDFQSTCSRPLRKRTDGIEVGVRGLGRACFPRRRQTASVAPLHLARFRRHPLSSRHRFGQP